MSLLSDAKATVAKFLINMGRFDQIMNGDKNTDVNIDVGSVPTIRKLFDYIVTNVVGVVVKGSVNTVNDLPTIGNKIGDIYIVTTAGANNAANDGYVWVGSQPWRNIGPIRGPQGLPGPSGTNFASSLARSEVITTRINRNNFKLNNDAPYAIGANTGLLALQDADGRWFELDVGSGRIDLRWLNMVPNEADAAVQTANAAAINGTMAAINNKRNGGYIEGAGYYYVSQSLDNRYPRITLAGPARDFFHDVGSAPFGLTFRTFANIDLLRHRTPTAAEAGISASQNQRISGGGFTRLNAIGGSRCLHVTSTGFGEYDIAAMNATGSEAVLFDCLADYRRPDVSQMGEASDTQYAHINLVVQQDGANGTRQADCLVFKGYDGCGNPSYIFGAKAALRHADGVGLRVKNGDNIVFDSMRTSQVGGSGGSFRIEAPVISGGFAGVCDGIEFNHYGANASGYVEGTADRANAATPAQLTIWKADASNGTPVPGSGADAYLKIHEINGLMYGLSMAQGAVGETLANAFQAHLRRRAGNSLYAYNTSDDHFCLDNGNTKLNINIDSSNGDARLMTTDGSGRIQMPRPIVSFIEAPSDAAAAAAGVVIDEVYLNTTSNSLRPRRN